MPLPCYYLLLRCYHALLLLLLFWVLLSYMLLQQRIAATGSHKQTNRINHKAGAMRY